MAPPSGLAVQGRCLRRMAVAPKAAGRGPRPLPAPTHGGAGRPAAHAQHLSYPPACGQELPDDDWIPGDSG
jgi:hypothetical protein